MGWKVFLGVFGSELFKTGFPNRENFSCFPPVCFTIPRHAAGREAASTQFDPKNDLPGGDQHGLCRQSRRVGPARALVEFDLASQLGGSCQATWQRIHLVICPRRDIILHRRWWP